MIKKVAITITCGVAAVSLCGCASGAAMLNEAQSVVADNYGEVESYLPEDIIDMITNGTGEQSTASSLEETTASSQEETAETEIAEETSAAEEPTKLVEETTAAEETTKSAEETTAAEETTKSEEETTAEETTKPAATITVKETVIELASDKATADGKEVTSSKGAVYISNDIIYYEDDDTYTSGNPYGAGTSEDKHTADEAKKNQVLNITEPGTYRLSGEWTGQVRVDLGDDAATDPEAVVNLLLDDANITCTVAPAILFQNVYEPVVKDAQQMTDIPGYAEIAADTDEDVDTAIDFDDDTADDTDDIDLDNDSDDTYDEQDADAFFEDLFNSMDRNNNRNSSNSNNSSRSKDPNLFRDEDGEMSDNELFQYFISMYGDEDDYDDYGYGYGTDSGWEDDLFAEEETKADDAKTDDAKTDDAKTENAKTDDAKTDDTVTTGRVEESEETSDTVSSAGAVITIADGSENTITGSHVAEIYEDTKAGEELVKQDGTITSCMSLRIDAEKEGDGNLSIVADREGIESHQDLTINGGHLDVLAADDAINANAEFSSCITVNDGILHIYGGSKNEGDAIDSNGALIINGGTVIASANIKADAALDSELGTFINGGTVAAFGTEMDQIDQTSSAVTMCLRFETEQKINKDILITDTDGKTVFALKASDDDMLSAVSRDYKELIVSSPEMKSGESYYVYIDDVQQTTTGTETVAVRPEGGFAPGAQVDPFARPDADQSYDILEMYEDVFEHFGIGMDEVKEYLEDNGSQATPQPFGRPEKPNDIFSNSNNEPQAASTQESGEPSKEFKTEGNVTVFIGVADLDKAASDDAEKETTTEASEKETTTEAADTKTEETTTAAEETTEKATEETTEKTTEEERTTAISSLGTNKGDSRAIRTRGVRVPKIGTIESEYDCYQLVKLKASLMR